MKNGLTMLILSGMRIVSARLELKAFTERYMSFCKKHHYIFQQDKPEKLFNASKELVAVFSKGEDL